jgi:hypothetical protein
MCVSGIEQEISKLALIAIQKTRSHKRGGEGMIVENTCGLHVMASERTRSGDIEVGEWNRMKKTRTRLSSGPKNPKLWRRGKGGDDQRKRVQIAWNAIKKHSS